MRALFLAFLVIVAVAFASFGSVGSAHAAPGDAASLKAEGDSLFDKGRFADAYDAYRRAYDKSRSPALLYNQARALEAMGEYPEALDKLDAFQTTAPPELRARVPRSLPRT
jgi:tetratricopeptide (TPR) repeat protein